MKLTRSHIRKMILEAIAGEPEVEEPEGEVVDLFDNPNFRGDLDTFQRVRTQGLASQAEKDDDLEDEWADYMANLPAGEEEEEEYLTEKTDDGAYPGQLGVGTPSGETDSSSATKQDVEDEIESTTAQINSIGSDSEKQQQKKVLQDQLKMLQAKLADIT
jgi:hypothetical protein